MVSLVISLFLDIHPQKNREAFKALFLPALKAFFAVEVAKSGKKTKPGLTTGSPHLHLIHRLGLPKC